MYFLEVSEIVSILNWCQLAKLYYEKKQMRMEAHGQKQSLHC
jgi:hypothetical protein